MQETSENQKILNIDWINKEIKRSQTLEEKVAKFVQVSTHNHAIASIVTYVHRYAICYVRMYVAMYQYVATQLQGIYFMIIHIAMPISFPIDT